MSSLRVGSLFLSALLMPLSACNDPCVGDLCQSGANGTDGGATITGSTDPMIPMAEPASGGGTTAGDGTGTGNGTATSTGNDSNLDGGSEGDGASAGSTSTGGTGDSIECGSDADCLEPTPVCDMETGICVGCVGDADCPIGWGCDVPTNVCVPSCEKDADCPAGQACILGLCETVDCMVDPDCPPGSSCVDGTCAAVVCADDTDCGTGAICDQGLGVCVVLDWPGNECVSSSDCPPSLGCGAGYCLRCQGNGDYCNECADTELDCNNNNVCNTELAACVECVVDDDCFVGGVDVGKVCHPYGECRPPCATNDDCPQTRVCDGFARCVPPTGGTECMEDVDCPVAMNCVSQLCRACPSDEPDGACMPCQPGVADPCGDEIEGVCDYEVFVCVQCNEDIDCSGDDLCQLGACSPPCMDDADCLSPSVCNTGSNRCEMMTP